MQEIKDRLDIAEVLSGYIKISKAGRNFKALCPFHNEKTPSLVISPERQIWHCFGCLEGGDIFTFVMKIEGMEFPEALRHLAEKAGVELKKTNFQASGAKAKILEINRAAKNFYQEQLAKTEVGSLAKKYLLGRGLTEESIGNFEIGYAPDAWSDTENFLIDRGFARKEIFSAGLTVQSEKPPRLASSQDGKNYYDRFRGRIMFPILDISGHTVGFGGRSFARKDTEEAKYINSPESASYSKSRILYGLNFARERIRKSDTCILVEGYMDVIGSHQMGVANAVASSGTALTLEQLKLIKRYGSRLILAFDGDIAGQDATRRSIDLAIASGFGVKVVILPSEKDPSDFVDNPEDWKKSVRQAINIMDFYFKNAFSKNNPSNLEGKKAIAGELLAVISKIPSGIEQAHWIEALGEKLDIDEKILLEELKKTQASKKIGKEPAKSFSEQGLLVKNNEGLEGYLLALLVLSPDIFGNLKKISEREFVFKNSEFHKIFDAIRGFEGAYLRAEVLMIELKKALSPDLYGNLSEMCLKAEYYYNLENEQDKPNKLFEELLDRLVLKQFEIKQKNLEKDIKIAEKNKDCESTKLFMKELDEISQKKEKFKKQYF